MRVGSLTYKAHHGFTIPCNVALMFHSHTLNGSTADAPLGQKSLNETPRLTDSTRKGKPIDMPRPWCHESTVRRALYKGCTWALHHNFHCQYHCLYSSFTLRSSRTLVKRQQIEGYVRERRSLTHCLRSINCGRKGGRGKGGLASADIVEDVSADWMRALTGL